MTRPNTAIWPRMPRAVAAMTVLSLTAAVGGSVQLSHYTPDYAVLPWLLALLPTFLLSYRGGWKGAAIGLQLGVGAVLFAELLRVGLGLAAFDAPRLAFFLLTFAAVSAGLGWVAELLHRQRALAEKNASEVIMVLAADGVIRHASASVERVFGYAPRDVVGRPFFDFLHPDDAERVRLIHTRGVQIQGYEEEVDLRFRHRGGSWRVLETRGRNLLDDPEVRGVLLSSRDVTSRRNLEEQLRHAHRLESVGRLTGGVAHDFNNILTAISAQSAFLLEETAEEDVRHAEIVGIASAVDRARELTQQLLAFSRQQVLRPDRVDLNDLVSEVVRMLRRTVKENVAIGWTEERGLDMVEADPTQLRQVLMNLVVNAADAMPDGGTLTIRARNRRLDPEFAASFPYAVHPGEYVELAVSDTGVGIAPELLDQVFEPFFTTKGEEGTGLGLSTVYGIVKQSGGYVWIDSDPARGTTVNVVLPATERRETNVVLETETAVPRDADTRRVLVVEDDVAVREVLERILLRAGHAVVVAESAAEALEVLAAGARLDLLLTDVVMPGMSGVDLARQAKEVRPEIDVLLMSGYTRHELDDAPGADAPAFLQKPFTPAELLAALAAAAPPAPGPHFTGASTA